MKRVAWTGLVLPLLGCLLPFVHSHREPPHSPEAVQRFSSQAQALTRTPGAPDLPHVTRSMGDAIEALPDVKDGEQLAEQVRKQADAMPQQGPDETDALARASLEAALEAVRRAKPAVPQRDKDQAIDVARHAIEKIEPGQRATVLLAYREVARAMVVVTGGRTLTGSELSQLVERFAVEEPDDARRTGAQAIAAIADELPGLPLPPEHARHTARELRKRADRLAKAASLDYAGQIKEALSLVVGALDRGAMPPAERRLLDDAKVAVEGIRGDRPVDLQQAAVAEALRAISDALSVSVSAR
jgi:hypothetical protein